MHLPVLAKFTGVLAECICVTNICKVGSLVICSIGSFLKPAFRMFPYDYCVGNPILHLQTNCLVLCLLIASFKWIGEGPSLWLWNFKLRKGSSVYSIQRWRRACNCNQQMSVNMHHWPSTVQTLLHGAALWPPWYMAPSVLCVIQHLNSKLI